MFKQVQVKYARFCIFYLLHKQAKQNLAKTLKLFKQVFLSPLL
jgi:hypothetical protein